MSLNRSRILLASFVLFFLASTLLTAQSASNPIQLQKKFTFHVGAGGTYFAFSELDDPTLNLHKEKTRETYNYNASFGYHPNEDWMFSLSGSLLRVSARTNDIVAFSPTDTFFGYLEDKIQITTIGLTAERNVGSIGSFNGGYILGIDYFMYEDLGHFVVDDFSLTGSDIGFRGGLFLNYNLSNRLSLNVQVQYVLAVLNDPMYESKDPQLPIIVVSEDITRINLNVGLRFSILSNKAIKEKPLPLADDEYVPSNRFE